METSLSNEECSIRKSSIYLKIRRRTLDQTALIPTNLNIRRSTIHNRIQKQFEEAYNNSPRSRIAKMRASRAPTAIPTSSRAPAISTPTTQHSSIKKFSFEGKQSLRTEALHKVSTLCEQEMANTHKLLSKISNLQKDFEHGKTKLGLTKESQRPTLGNYSDLYFKTFDRRILTSKNRMKENYL